MLLGEDGEMCCRSAEPVLVMDGMLKGEISGKDRKRRCVKMMNVSL